MRPAVLITGASTGIGRAAAAHFAKTHHVYAQVRSLKDVESLQKENLAIQVLQFDVTDEHATTEQLKNIKIENHSSFSLINNAGITVQGPVEAVKMEDWRRQFDVNFFGLIQVTQKCLPMIRQSKGRVINVGSISGRVAAAFLAPYASSKFALNALSDSLRRELAPHGVKVIVIEPGPIQTPIWDKGLAQKAQMHEMMRPGILPLYQQHFERFINYIEKSAGQADPVDWVVQAIDKALTSPNPKTRYPVGRTAKLTTMIGQVLPDSWVDALVKKV